MIIKTHIINLTPLVSRNVLHISASYSITNDNDILILDSSNVTSNVVLTLPNAVGYTKDVIIKQLGSTTFNISVNTVSSQTIDNTATPIKINKTDRSLTFVSDNSNWIIT